MSAEPPPRIARVEARVLVVPFSGYLAHITSGTQICFVELEDACGHIGTGFTYTLAGGAVLARVAIEEVIAPAITGTDVASWASVADRLRDDTRQLGRHLMVAALSAVDIAVWDLRGRCADRPLPELFGAAATSLPIYGSGRSGNGMSTEELVAASRSYVDEGFDVVKIRVGARSVEQDRARAAAVRAAVGPDVTLLADANERLDLGSALRLGRHLEELDFGWLEEPLVAEDCNGHVELARRLRLPIAVGEHLHGLEEFGRYLDAGAASVLQPDITRCGGYTGGLRIAEAAARANVAVAYHSLPELHLPLALSTPTARYVEDFPVLSALLTDPVTVTGGVAHAAKAAGHGIAWDHSALDRHTVLQGRREGRT